MFASKFLFASHPANEEATGFDVTDVTPVPPFAIGNAVPEYPIAKVPVVVIGEPLTLRKEGTVASTDETEPLPLKVFQSVEDNNPVVVVFAVGIAVTLAAVTKPFPLTVIEGTLVEVPKEPTFELTVAKVNSVEPDTSPV